MFRHQNLVVWDEQKGIPMMEEKHHVLREKRNIRYASPGNYKFLELHSDVFSINGLIPRKYTCDGVNANPPINIRQIPSNTRSLAVIVDDPDAPDGNLCHWVAWNIPVTDCLMEGEHRGTPGKNDFGYFRYNGPCPQTGTHRYYFKIYALDCTLIIPASSDREEVEKAMRNHVVGFGFLVGKYHGRM